MKLSAIKNATRSIDEGVEKDCFIDGVKFRVRGKNNTAWNLKSQELNAKISTEDRLSTERMLVREREIETELLLHTVLLGWSGLTDDEGNEIPYSIEMARTILEDNDYRLLRSAIFDASLSVTSDAVSSLRADIKN